MSFKRRGRHSTPSQVEKVALQAGKAAPAVAIAGALVAAPAASHALAAAAQPAATTAGHQTAAAAKTADAAASTGPAATLDSFATRTVTVAAAKPARHSTAAKSTYYRVQGGDTLSSIADRYYHNASAWQYLYHENSKTVSDPNEIFVGERLLIPATVPAHYALTAYVPRHSKAAVPVREVAEKTSTTSHHSGNGGHSATIGGTADGGTVVVQKAASGSYTCSGLEAIWKEAGGNSADAFMAAEIAQAESGGNPNAISPTDDFGLWQINASNGSLATLNPLENAKSAIILSDDGSNWDAWTTYHSGAYYGKC